MAKCLQLMVLGRGYMGVHCTFNFPVNLKFFQNKKFSNLHIYTMMKEGMSQERQGHNLMQFMKLMGKGENKSM